MQKGQDEEKRKTLTAELVSAFLGCSLLLMKPEAHFSKFEFQLFAYQKKKARKL